MKHFLIILNAIFLYSCSGDEKDTPLKISDIDFVSSTIERCVAEYQSAGIIYADDLTQFYCDSYLIDTTADLKNFRNLDAVGFAGLGDMDIDFTNFSKISYFSLYDTYLESLNLTNLSVLNNLTMLELHNNYELRSIDFSALENLEKVLVLRSPLKEINTDGLVNLKDLKIYGSFIRHSQHFMAELEAVNFSQNINLEDLIIVGTTLPSLILNQHEKLVSLEFSGPLENVYIEAPSLENIGISGSLLTSIDVSKLPNLKNIRVKHGVLETINFESNLELMSADLTNNLLTNDTIEYLDSLPKHITVIY
ncbi:MAG: hypothetical protein HWE10_08665 [Gammaproteobacteria bacterium]|nr:hypothetical protein [Gammaproteobacteria bacterium]